MSTVEVIPGLVLDEEMFEAAAAGVADLAPDLAPLSWETITSASRWLNIPDDCGELSKSEMTLLNTAERTVRLNVWRRADLRGGEKPMPHNHPWQSFTGHVLLGGYAEARYELDPAGGVLAELDVQHASPAANVVGHDTYHEVSAVHAPGRTVSLMVCGRGRRGDWGYLDVDSGEHKRLQPVKDFAVMFAALNPHR